MIRETVVDGEPALAIDTEEEFARALGSGVYVVPPTMVDALGWHPWDEDNTDSLADVLATDDDPDPAQDDASGPLGWVIRHQYDLGIEEPLHLVAKPGVLVAAGAVDTEPPHELRERIPEDELSALRPRGRTCTTERSKGRCYSRRRRR